MGNTGIVADTKIVVAGVKERKEKEAEKYDHIFKRRRELVSRRKKAN